MKRKTKILLAFVGLVISSLACQGLTTGPKLPLSDDFSFVRWGTGTDADSSIEYVNNALQMIVYTKQWFIWSTPNAKSYQDVHIEVTVLNHDTDSTTAVGIICNKQPSTSNFYYVAITPAGQYAIAKAVDGQSDVFLTNNDQWGTSDAIAQNAASYRIGADCGNGTITLFVDGQQIASVADTTYTSGGIGLLAWSGEESTNTNVSYDDFLMTKLP
jgi:hypothetical protein